MSWSDMSDEERVGCGLRGGHADMSHGIQALNGQMDPCELLMAAEDAQEDDGEAERALVRAEVFCAVLGWCFSDGRPEEPPLVGARLFALVREFFPGVLAGYNVRVEVPAGCGVSLRGVARDVFREGELRELRVETARRMVGWLFADVAAAKATKKLYAVAKSFAPELLGGASLETLGEWFEGGGRSGHRARWSARIKVIVNAAVESVGGVAHAPFQKSASASEVYRRVQMGNCNRLSGKRSG